MSTRHFSKLKKRLEDLFVAELHLRIDCFAFANRTRWGEMKIPRFTVKLKREVIWDFPRDFPIKDETPYVWDQMVDISSLIRDYIDAPVEALMISSFILEQVRPYRVWPYTYEGPNRLYGINLTPLFIAADRRIGRTRLLEWAEQWPKESAVHRVLAARMAPPRNNKDIDDKIIFS